jgi:hypothetical protein
MTAIVTIKINCGCGFTATKIEDGEKHVTTTGHTLHLQGEIKSN